MTTTTTKIKEQTKKVCLIKRQNRISENNPKVYQGEWMNNLPYSHTMRHSLLSNERNKYTKIKISKTLY